MSPNPGKQELSADAFRMTLDKIIKQCKKNFNESDKKSTKPRMKPDAIFPTSTCENWKDFADKLDSIEIENPERAAQNKVRFDPDCFGKGMPGFILKKDYEISNEEDFVKILMATADNHKKISSGKNFLGIRENSKLHRCYKGIENDIKVLLETRKVMSIKCDRSKIN